MRKELKFGAWNRAKNDQFFTQLEEWEQYVFEEYKGYVKDANFESITKHSVNMKGMLDALPANVRNRLIGQYKSIIGFDGYMEEAQKMDAFRVLKEGVAPARNVKVDPSQLKGPDAHPLAFIYNRFFVQGEGTSDAPFNIGKNILRSQYLRGIMDSSTNGSKLTAGQKVMVFDTETSGLPYGSVRGSKQHFPDVRQISAAIMDVDSSGQLGAPNLVFDEHFTTARMQLGHLATGGTKTTRMDKAIEKLFMGGKKFRNKLPGEGEDFVNALRPFLQQMIDSDVLVGQNVQFDIDQIFGGLSRTRAYLNNEGGFGDLLDQARDSVMKHGKIRDTLEIARVQLHDIDVAKEIRFAGNRATRHSIENLMLQSNLPDLLRKDMGEQQLLDLLGSTRGSGSMHAAEVDTRIEGYLYKYLTEGRLISKAAKLDAVGSQIREAVLKSYAPTPISNIADISHIDKKLFAAMVAEGDSIRVMDANGANMDISGMRADELHSMLSGPGAKHASYRVTPLEQEIFSTRRNMDISDNVDDARLTMRQGQFRRWAGTEEEYAGFLNRFATLFRRGIRPSDESFRSLQNNLAREGVPFAGISMPERWLTSGLARASVLDGPTRRALGENLTGKVASFAEDLGISRFALWDQAYISPGSGRNITLPIEILQAAEEAGVLSSKLSNTMRPLGEEAQMLSLSAFETGSGKKIVNLTYNFGEEGEAKALSTWLGNMKMSDEVAGKSLSSYGFSPTKLRDIVAALPESGAKHGIGVARLGGRAGEVAYSLLEDFHQGMLRDVDKIPMRVGWMGTKGRVAEVGAVVLDRFMDSGAKQDYSADLSRAAKRQVGMERAITKKGMLEAAQLAAKTGRPEMVERSMQAYNVVKKKLPIIGGIAALTIGGYYLGKKRHEQNKYDVALEQMSYESQKDYDSYRETMGLPQAQAKRIMDPLATAGVVGNLDRSKTGHTQMGLAGKYSDLYVGAI